MDILDTYIDSLLTHVIEALRISKVNGQGHSLTFVQGNSDLTFSNFFSLETPLPIEAKFHVQPPWIGGNIHLDFRLRKERKKYITVNNNIYKTLGGLACANVKFNYYMPSYFVLGVGRCLLH